MPTSPISHSNDIHTTPFTTASYGLMKKLSMDCIGPLKETEDGYTHILVIIDNFSRYASLYVYMHSEASPL